MIFDFISVTQRGLKHKTIFEVYNWGNRRKCINENMFER